MLTDLCCHRRLVHRGLRSFSSKAPREKTSKSMLLSSGVVGFLHHDWSLRCPSCDVSYAKWSGDLTHGPARRGALMRKPWVPVHYYRWEEQTLPLHVSIRTSLLAEAACFRGKGGVVSMQHARRASAARKRKAGPCRGTTQPNQANRKYKEQNKKTDILSFLATKTC